MKVVKGLQAEWGACSCTVSLSHIPGSLVHWKDTIAVGSESGDIIILDVVTGIYTSVLSGHTGEVECLAFSSDGTFLVSGGMDATIKLWDIQTGGVVKTYAHTSQTCTVSKSGNNPSVSYTNIISSVSISQDHSVIAVGSYNNIYLWDTWPGVCYYVIGGLSDTHFVTFSPINPQLLVSTSGSGIQHWDLGGQQIGPTYPGHYIAFSSDGTHFVSWGESVSRVQSSESGAVVAELDKIYRSCCFSPNGKLLACATYNKIDIWDITIIPWSHQHYHWYARG